MNYSEHRLKGVCLPAGITRVVPGKLGVFVGRQYTFYDIVFDRSSACLCCIGPTFSTLSRCPTIELW